MEPKQSIGGVLLDDGARGQFRGLLAVLRCAAENQAAVELQRAAWEIRAVGNEGRVQAVHLQCFRALPAKRASSAGARVTVLLGTPFSSRTNGTAGPAATPAG